MAGPYDIDDGEPSAPTAEPVPGYSDSPMLVADRRTVPVGPRRIADDPAEADGEPRTGLQTLVWSGVRWTMSTVAVAGISLLLGVIALWAGSWISHTSINDVALRWDGDWYYNIAQQGYVSEVPAPVKVITPATIHRPSLRAAFFPGLPLVERLVHRIIGGPPLATLLVVGALGIVASCLLLRAWVERTFGPGAAWRATVLFAFFPGAYVFVMGYSEVLEIPLALLALYSLRRRWYVLAGLAAAAATTTRLTGVAVVAACGIAALRELVAALQARRRDRPLQPWPLVTSFLSPVVGLAGLVGYLVFLQERTGNFLAFQKAERLGWGNTVSLAEPYRVLQRFADSPFKVPYITVDAAGTVVVLACLILLATDGLRRLRLEESVYAAVILLAWMFTTATGAWFRFVESAFPVLVLLVLRLDRRWYPAVAAAGAFLLGILTVLFASTVAFSP